MSSSRSVDIASVLLAEAELYERTIAKGLVKLEEIIREVKGMPAKAKNRVPTNCKPLIHHIAECEMCVVSIFHTAPNPDPLGVERMGLPHWRVNLCPVGTALGRGEWF